jgi:UDP-2,4-diacetamido-2,4,6-trideoxy-beta-L-altropyranose hydrolase
MLESTSEYILKPRLFFRVDASPSIGLGHLIRSSALASMLSDFFYCILVTHDLPELLLKHSCAAFYEIIILEHPDVASFLCQIPNDAVIILDGYHFDYDFQVALKKEGHFLISIDDTHKTHFVSNIVINHGLNINSDDYSCEPYTKLFTGLNYMMLREPFFKMMKEERKIERSKNLLVIPGGSDMKDISITLLENGVEKWFEHVHFISGAGTVSFERLMSAARTKQNVTVHKNVNAEELIKIAKGCDISICTPSGISYELSCIGIGLILCMIAENQQHFFDFFLENKLAVGCRYMNENDRDNLLQLIEVMRSDLNLVNQQIINQKSFFSINSKANLLEILKPI